MKEFDCAHNVDEFLEDLFSLNEKNCVKSLRVIRNIEDGNASRRIAKLILDQLNK